MYVSHEPALRKAHIQNLVCEEVGIVMNNVSVGMLVSQYRETSMCLYTFVCLLQPPTFCGILQ